MCMKEMLYVLFIIFLVPLAYSTESTYTVNTKKGAVRGKRIVSYGNQIGYAFAGIPFAKPPIGNLRFKAAVPAERWSGVLDAFQYRNACLSDPKLTYKTDAGGPVSEDCLYLNVFTSGKCLKQGGCAVMPVFHGGQFIFESPVIFQMDVIINNFANDERNVIVVTLPFRLGPLAWFNIAPGMGLDADSNLSYRDTLHSLKWIQEEIGAFGGDPNRVTIFGHSSGASLAQSISILPQAEGLFNQVVAMSGASRGTELYRTANSKYSQKMAKLLGCAEEDESFAKKSQVEKILSCIRAKDGNEILRVQMKMYNDVEELSGPYMDHPEDGIFPKLSRDLQKDFIRSKRKLNVLLGTVTGEIRDMRHAADKDGNAIPERLETTCTDYSYILNYDKPEKFRQICKEYYGRKNMIQFFDDDLSFYVNNGNMADLFSVTGSCYVYSYEYTGAGPAFKKYRPNGYFGPSHSEDYIYILGLHRDNDHFTAKDYMIERIYSGIVANFVNHGDPSYEEKWQLWDPTKRNYFLIDFDEQLKMPGNREGYYPHAAWFWNNYTTEKAGNSTPLMDLPKEADSVSGLAIVDDLVGHWTKKAYTHSKTAEALEQIFNIWDGHIKKLRLKHFLGIRALNSSEPLVPEEKTDGGGGIGVLTIIGGSLVLVLVLVFALTKVNQCRKRRNYNEI